MSVLVLVIFADAGLAGCDLCAVASATESAGVTSAGAGAAVGSISAASSLATDGGSSARLTLGLLGEYRHAGTLRQDGVTVPDPVDQYLDTTLVQLVVGWRFSPTWGVRIYLPVIHRRYRRATADGAAEGWYTGIGDALAQVVASGQVRRDGRHFAVGNVFAGVELPSGDSGQLAYVRSEIGSASGAGAGDIVAGASGFGR